MPISPFVPWGFVNFPKYIKSSFQTLFKILVASVYLLNVVYAACALGAHGGYQQGNSGAYVGRTHGARSQLKLLVVPDDHCSVGVA